MTLFKDKTNANECLSKYVPLFWNVAVPRLSPYNSHSRRKLIVKTSRENTWKWYRDWSCNGSIHLANWWVRKDLRINWILLQHVNLSAPPPPPGLKPSTCFCQLSKAQNYIDLWRFHISNMLSWDALCIVTDNFIQKSSFFIHVFHACIIITCNGIHFVLC